VSEETLTEIQIYTGSDGNSDIWAENQLATNQFKKKMTKDATTVGHGAWHEKPCLGVFPARICHASSMF